ncbi:hypothetical protein BBJ28_00023517 [Nothophytophthora sp. Chile5]|nr:hypothetical protein BBJ28_00023517 [Nothophytophthora sp. Chile5]
MLLDDKLLEPGLFQPSEHLEPLNYSNKRAASNATQLRFLLRRFFVLYWRTPTYNLTRFAVSLLLGFVFGIVYLNAEYTTYQGINSGLGMIFLSTIFVGVVSMISGLPVTFEERSVFYRERAAQTYNTLWYFVSFSVVELPYVLVCALLFTVVYYPMVGFVGFASGVFYWFNIALMILFQVYLGQLLIIALPTIEVAAIMGMLFNSICWMFMGFNPPALQIPSGYKWLYAIVPHRYSFAVLVGIVFGDCSDSQLAEISAVAAEPGDVASLDLSDYPLGCRIVQNAPLSVGEIPLKVYVQEVFGVKHQHIAQYIGIFLGIIVLFRLLAALCMRYVNHQQR